MEFATVALRSLLPKLAQLLQEEYNLQKGAKKDVEFLSSELKTMHAALRKVGEVPREQLEELLMIWARDVKDLSYDMEDMVDTFIVDVQGLDAPSKRSIRKLFKKMVKKVTKVMARREIAHEIKDIKERVKEVAERRDRFNLDVIITPAKITHFDSRIIALYTDATKLVGIGKAKEDVITRLTKGGDAQQQERIISIAGFGGLGKTTLAKAVYDEIQGQFDCTAFVSVSRNPDTKKVLKDILYELQKKGVHGNIIPAGANSDDIKNLIDLVRESLQNMRYLVVIDDIWDMEPWQIILCALNIENNMGSRIITTTRNIGVAEQIGGCYRLNPLSDESSKLLFYGRIFGEDKCPEQFSEVSKKILKKCGGVPLAILTTSSLLANKSESIKEWYDVCDSIGLGLGNNPNMDNMRKILLLSYYDLPPHLKTCLLYLSIFPEDYVIRKDQLLWRWVAEGFVQRGPEEVQSFHEIGESYFNELLNRSLIQPANKDVEGTPQACRVHDTVLDIIISLSKEECRFITTVSGDEKHNSLESNNQVRWLSLHDDTTNWPTMNMPKLRCLTLFKPAALVIHPRPSLSCHLLRVLDLQGWELEDLTSLGFVGSLSHLRYLSLSSSSGRRLPVEIEKLRFLQTLDLTETRVAELPSNFVELTQLICLRGSGYHHHCMTRLPDGWSKNLTSLEVLESAIVTSKSIAEELDHLTHSLRALTVTVQLPEDEQPSLVMAACGKAMAESLGKLKRIESLDIRFKPRYSGITMDGWVQQPLHSLRRLHFDLIWTVPTWINGASLPALSSLNIMVQHERGEDIKVLGTLPCLRHLTFHVLGRPDQPLERCVVGAGAFACAVRCDFEECNPMAPSIFLRGAMNRLEEFRFTVNLERYFCGDDAVYSVDDLVLEHLPSLRSVVVNIDGTRNVSLEVRRSVEEKLRHEAAVHPNQPRIELVM